MNRIDHHARPLVLDAAQVRHYLPQLPLAETLRALYLSLARQRAVQPPQSLTLFPDGGGDFITYQGVLADAAVFGAKLSPYIVTGGKPVITAWTSLLSMQTGQPLLFCDAGLLTVARTAATTALAVDQLARPDSRHLALIGCGALGQAHLQQVLPLRDWDRVTVYAPTLAGDSALQQQLRAIDARIRIANDSDDCCDGADVIMLCTSSAGPVLDVTRLSRPALITSISTNAPLAHEVAPASLAQMDVYCDDKHSTPDSAGEMVLAERGQHWQRSHIAGDLADLLDQRCARPDYRRPVFFRSIGMGLQDVAIATALLACAQQAGA